MTIDYATELENRKARERAEMDSFAVAIGGTLDIDADYGTVRSVCVTVDGIDCRIVSEWRKGNQWIVSFESPKNANGQEPSFHNESKPTIGVAKSRGPDALLADIRRRLVPAAREWSGKCAERARESDAFDAAIAANVAKLASVARSRGMEVQESHDRRGYGCDGYLYVNGERVRVGSSYFQVERPYWDDAESMAAAIATMRK